MSWLLAEHEGLGLYNRTADGVPDKSNNFVFFSFAMVPKYIYLENARHKYLLNTVSLALCLATGSDRIIAKQGNNLIIELVCYDTKSLCLPFSPVSRLYFILIHRKSDYDNNLTTSFQLSPYLKASEYLPKTKILKRNLKLL